MRHVAGIGVTRLDRHKIAMRSSSSVSEYLAAQPPRQRALLRQIRAAVKKAGKLDERMSYRIPTFYVGDKYVLYMAGFKDHVSIYPVTSGMIVKYGKRIAPYRSGRGTLRFPLDKKLPLGLITSLAKVRVKERIGP